MTLPRNIMVATDFSASSTRALDYAVELAAKLGAVVHVVHAVGLQALGIEYGVTLAQEVIEAQLAADTKEVEAQVAARKGKAEFGPIQIQFGDPRTTILELANVVHADLLIMGTHGRTGVRRFVLGSVAEVVARQAPCPVLLVRDPGA